MKSPDQVSLACAYAPKRTTKLQNKSRFQGSILGELMNFASSVPDFRRTGKGNIRHRMADIIMLMILGRTSGRVGRAGDNRVRQTQSRQIPQDGHAQERGAVRGDAVPY